MLGPTCQAAECAGSCGAMLAIHTTGERGDSNGKESEGRKEEGGEEEITPARHEQGVCLCAPPFFMYT